MSLEMNRQVHKKVIDYIFKDIEFSFRTDVFRKNVINKISTNPSFFKSRFKGLIDFRISNESHNLEEDITYFIMCISQLRELIASGDEITSMVNISENLLSIVNENFPLGDITDENRVLYLKVYDTLAFSKMVFINGTSEDVFAKLKENNFVIEYFNNSRDFLKVCSNIKEFIIRDSVSYPVKLLDMELEINDVFIMLSKEIFINRIEYIDFLSSDYCFSNILKKKRE